MYFCCSLWRLYPPFTSDSILSCNKSKFREKCPRSCRSFRTLDPRSKWGFADFHGVQIIASQKSPVICNIITSMDNQAQCSEVLQITLLCQNRRLKIKRPRAWNMSAHNANTIEWRLQWDQRQYHRVETAAGHTTLTPQRGDCSGTHHANTTERGLQWDTPR